MIRPAKMVGKTRIKDRGSHILAFLVLALVSIFMVPHMAFPGDIDAGYVLSIGKNLPPDPGADGQKTLVGSDVNTNGVRDDVELWIFVAMADRPLLMAAALQFAGVMQKVMIAGVDADNATVTNLKNHIRTSVECLFATVADEDQEAFFGGLSSVILDTTERVALIARLEEIYPDSGGISISDPKPEACAIAPNLLQNQGEF